VANPGLLRKMAVKTERDSEWWINESGHVHCKQLWASC